MTESQRAPVVIPRERGTRRVKIQFHEDRGVVDWLREQAREEFPRADGTGNEAALIRALIREAREARDRRRAARRPLFSDG